MAAELLDQFGRRVWTPDPQKCAEADEYLRKKEWLRKKTGFNGTRPSELGIERYRWGSKLPAKFYEGQTPPPVPLDSAENIEWYEEQLKRCIYGFEYKGYRITGDHYWMLNFMPIPVVKKDKNGNQTNEFKILLPYYSHIHDYVFKLFEEAMYTNKIIMFMSARGTGKTYSVLSVAAKYYQLFPESHNVISASGSGHANEAFSKFLMMLDAMAEVHPTLILSRIKDTNSMIESGYEIVRDGVKYKEGPRSKAQKVIYGDNPGVTRGWRPDTQVLEEIGAWSSGKANLTECIAASKGSWRVGPIMKTRVFMTGTGGSVESDQALNVALNADAYDILTVSDFRPKVCITIPAHYLAGGFWEKTGVNDNEGAKEFYDKERLRTKTDLAFHQRLIQEYPFNFDEMFMKTGSNIFDQEKIGTQWTRIEYAEDGIKYPTVGRLEWNKNSAGKITGVRFEEDPAGHIEILERPYHGQSGKRVYENLYVMGVDSIDMGQLESTSSKNRSNIAALVKKRIVPGEYFKQTSNIYVAKYVNRSDFINTDYENVLKLAVYYATKVNLEYTRTNIIAYFKKWKMDSLFMKRPQVAMPKNSRDPIEIQKLREQTLIGTTTATGVIDHQDMLIQEYINIYYDTIYFKDLLENLRDYRRNDRRRYDLVIAMGLCEIADEELMSEPAFEVNKDQDEFVDFGWYVDANGYRKFGPLSSGNSIERETKPKELEPVWIDMGGNSRFDDKFDVLNILDNE